MTEELTDLERIERQEAVNKTNKVIWETKEAKALGLAYGVVVSMMTTPVGTTIKDFFIVWSCKTLQNWKFIISASFKGAPLVEVTYNGDKKETYIDVYTKIENVRIPD